MENWLRVFLIWGVTLSGESHSVDIQREDAAAGERQGGQLEEYLNTLVLNCVLQLTRVEETAFNGKVVFTDVEILKQSRVKLCDPNRSLIDISWASRNSFLG
jgi:hypothetical protein